MRAWILPLFMLGLITIRLTAPIQRPKPPPMMPSLQVGQTFALYCRRVIGIVATKSRAPTTQELQNIFSGMQQKLNIQVFFDQQTPVISYKFKVQCIQPVTMSAATLQLYHGMLKDTDVAITTDGASFKGRPTATISPGTSSNSASATTPLAHTITGPALVMVSTL